MCGAQSSWFTEAGGRRIIYREGSTTAPIVRVPLREVLDHADRRLSAAEWQRIDQLVVARGAAIADAHPRDGHRAPARRTDAENARIAAGHRAKTAAERELRAIIAAALDDRPRVGDQLNLFADG